MFEEILWMFSVETQVGWLRVEGNQYFVTSAAFEYVRPEADFGQCVLKEKAIKQTLAYLEGHQHEFDLPLMTRGSDFQHRVWVQLADIPAGQTRTYGEIASRLGSSPRAVGNACRKNPVAVIVPCHRVVSANGIGGYAGHTAGQHLSVKAWLLQHEA